MQKTRYAPIKLPRIWKREPHYLDAMVPRQLPLLIGVGVMTEPAKLPEMVRFDVIIAEE